MKFLVSFLFVSAMPLLFLVCTMSTQLYAVEGTSDAAKTELKEADRLFELANNAMNMINEDSARSVDAAVYMDKARAIYKKYEKWDQVREANAYIFYCKKKMNVNELDEYVARLGKAEGAAVIERFKVIETEVASIMTSEESKASFLSAKKFANNNPEEYLKIHMRFLEIAERAVSSSPQVAIEANRLSSDALQEWVADKSGATVISASPFTKPERRVSLFGGDDGLALSSSSDLKKISRLIQDKYKADIKGPFRHQGARNLFKLAKESLDQPDYSYCYAIEAADLAGDKRVSDISMMMQIAKFIADNFAGQDQAELQVQFLKGCRSGASKEAQKLFKDIDDPEANAVVGLSYCLWSNNWKEGLAMLMRSQNPELIKLCKMEEAGSKVANEQRQTGDAWYELAQNRDYKDYKGSIIARSAHWYIKAKPKLKGISKEQVEERIIDAGRILPVKGLEGYPNMFAKARPGSMPNDKAWLGLVGAVFKVNANRRNEYTGVDLLPGQAIRVVPNVKERWTVGGWGGNYLGTGYRYSGDSWNEGMILVRVGSGPWIDPKDAIIGEGKVYVTCWRGGNSSSNGQIHVKLIKMQ